MRRLGQKAQPEERSLFLTVVHTQSFLPWAVTSCHLCCSLTPLVLQREQRTRTGISIQDPGAPRDIQHPSFMLSFLLRASQTSAVILASPTLVDRSALQELQSLSWVGASVRICSRCCLALEALPQGQEMLQQCLQDFS